MQKTIVGNEEILYRRVQAGKNNTVPQPDGTFKVSGQAFRDPNYRPSVNRAELCDHDPSQVQIDETDGVVSLLTLDVRNTDSVKMYDGDRPIKSYDIDVEHMPEEKNIAHSEIYMKPASKSRGVFHRLQERLAILANNRGWEIEIQE